MPRSTVGRRFDSALALAAVVACAFLCSAGDLHGQSEHAATSVAPARGTLRGRVIALPDSVPVPEAVVTISGTALDPDHPVARRGAAQGSRLVVETDARGSFETVLDAGRYDVAVEAFGFGTERRAIQVGGSATAVITVCLEVAPFPLDEIVVTPSTYGIFKSPLAGTQVLSREEVRVMPHFSDDIYRSVNRLPGVATYDVSAKIRVRGAPSREVLTVLDGLELYEPYHMKDWDGALSIIDVESVSDVDLSTGGFSVEYGDKSAGVFAMRSATPPPDRTRTTLGMSLMNLTFEREGGFAGERGAYTVSARRGFLDLLFALTGENQGRHSFRAHEGDSDETIAMVPGDLHPTYYDAFAKVQYQLRPGHLLSAHLLHAGDHMRGMEEDSTRFDHHYGSSYLWTNWDAEFSRELSATTMLSLGRVTQDRNGGNYVNGSSGAEAEEVLDVRDEVGYDFVGLKQDWRYQISDRAMLKAGYDLKRGRADYDYFRWRRTEVPNTTDPSAPPWTLRWDTLRVATSRSGTEAGAYLAVRARPLRRLTFELGGRYDGQSRTGEGSMAPRVSAALEVARGTTLRGAWGHYYQSQGLQELWTADGDTTFYRAQRAEHRVLGLEHRLPDGTTLRVEAYQRLTAHPLPEYRNLIPRIEGLREEDPDDRRFVAPTQAKARGLELMARSSMKGRFAWSASYALSVAEEEVEGAWVPRPFDQRHALQLQTAYRPNPDWSLSADWVYHSPWPYTPETFTLEHVVTGASYAAGHFGPMNEARLPAYHRMDVRASRRFVVGRSELSVYLDFFNVYNRRNAQAMEYYPRLDQGHLVVDQEVQDQLGILPTFGLRWVF